MTFRDTISLAFRNLRQAKLRTFLTTLGVAIGIAFLAGMVSFGVGLQDQLVGRFTESGLFDSITVTSRELPPVLGGEARGRGARAGDSDRAGSRPRLDEEAVRRLSGLPDVVGVYPVLRLPLQMKFRDFSALTMAGAVPPSAASEGAYRNITHGKFFENETDDACMLSLDTANRMNDGDAKAIVGQAITLEYAIKAEGGAQAALLPSIPGIDLGGVQMRRVEYKCNVIGIVERDTGPAILGSAGLSGLLLPLAKASAIYNVQVLDVGSLMRNSSAARAYPSITVKVSGARKTQDVEAEIKRLGYSAFSLNDMLQGAKRAFLILDIVLALIGSIALVISSLGIANTMVMSILERTREIGVMKAIGGSDGDVRKIFLIEASAIGVLGGIGGVALGWVVGRLANFGANIYIVGQGGTAGDLFSMPLWLIGSAVAFSVLLSLLAGSYPANRAARLDPIQALRHD